MSALNFNNENTFNNLTFLSPTTNPRIFSITLFANQIVNGTLTIGGSSTGSRRIFFGSSSSSSPRTITAGTIATLSDVDFRDIIAAGTSSPWSGTRLGNCLGNTNITFDAGKTVYWNLGATNQNWGSTAWALSSGGTPNENNFPLAQDTAVFDDDGDTPSTQIQVTSLWHIGTIDMSARTTEFNLSYQITCSHYGSLTLFSNLTLTQTSRMSFRCRGTTQTITTAGKTFQSIGIDAPTGTVQLEDSLTCTSDVQLTQGAFNANGYNVTCSGLSASGSGTRTLTLGNGLWTLTATGGVWDLVSTNLTFDAGSSDILLTNTTSTARTFSGGGLTYNKLTIGGTTGTSTTTITNSNGVFSELASTKTVAHSIEFGANQKVERWSVTGSALPVSGFQNILSNSSYSIAAADVGGYRINYLVAPDSSISGTTPAYISDNHSLVTSNIILVFRPNTTPSSVTVNSLNNYADEGVLTSPANQTITSGSGTTPLIALALYQQTGAGTITTRSFSPAQDGEVSGPIHVSYIKYKIYNSSPSDITVGMTSTTGTARGLASFYLQVNGASSVSFVASSTTGVVPAVQAGDIVVSYIIAADSNSSTPILVPVSPTNNVVIGSNTNGTSRSILVTNKTENVDYLTIRDIFLNIHSSNTYIFYAGANSTNVLNNQNIAFIDRSTNNRQVAQLLGSSNTSWTTPINWNNSNNKIYMMAGGGAGGNNSVSGTSRAAAGGGGGGGFGVITNFNSSPGTVISCSIASTTARPNIDGGNTSWASTYTVVGGKRGNAAGVAQSSTGGAGGDYTPTSNPEFVGFTGGTGGAGAFGTAASTGYGGGGGGGAAGLFGNGANGGNGFGSATLANIAGGGGGGNGGGSNGGNASAAVGGTGGNGWLGTGGPVGITDTLQNTGAGAVGSTGSTPARPAKGIEILNTIGGAGGYGGKRDDSVGPAAPASYSYGFGGGGGGMNTAGGASSGMNGGPGFIFIVYTEIDLPNFGYRISNTGTLFVQQTSNFDEITQTKIQVANTVFYAEEFDEVTNPGIPLRMLNTGVVQTQGIIDEITGIF